MTPDDCTARHAEHKISASFRRHNGAGHGDEISSLHVRTVTVEFRHCSHLPLNLYEQ